MHACALPVASPLPASCDILSAVLFHNKTVALFAEHQLQSYNKLFTDMIRT